MERSKHVRGVLLAAVLAVSGCQGLLGIEDWTERASTGGAGSTDPDASAAGAGGTTGTDPDASAVGAGGTNGTDPDASAAGAGGTNGTDPDASAAGAGGTTGDGGTDGSTGGSGARDGGTDGSMSSDPCDTDNGGCDPLVTCASVGGIVTCDPCPSGYDDTNGDGTNCAPVDCGAPGSSSDLSVSTPGGTTYNQTATYSCNTGYTLSGSATRTCQANGNWTGSVPTCVDFNACSGTPVCTADYPCQDLSAPSLNYTCRGQFADWPPADSPSTFTDNGNGTVTDLRSGLEWQQTVDAGSYTWANALAYCAGLSLVGTGWRLPTKAEIESIVDFGRINPAIDPVAFPSTPPASDFWSSSAYAGGAGNAWLVNINTGSSNYYGTSGTSRLRCVRSSTPVTASNGIGGAPPGRYTIDSVAGTVYDTQTALTWQQAVPNAPVAAGCSGATCTQAGALAYCAGLSLDGGGWRMPKLSELLTLVEPTQVSPAIDAAAFPSTPSVVFWSSSGYAGGGANAWYVNFADGNSNVNATSSVDRVRCVR